MNGGSDVAEGAGLAVARAVLNEGISLYEELAQAAARQGDHEEAADLRIAVEQKRERLRRLDQAA